MNSLRADKNILLCDLLLDRIHGLKRSTLKDYLRQGFVFVNHKPVTHFNFQLKAGDEIQIQKDKTKAQTQRLRSNIDIVYEDQDLIVINKPSGLLTVATEKERRKTAFFQVYEYLKNAQASSRPAARGRNSRETLRPLFIVHRLDQDASGLLVLAKNLNTKLFLQEHWQEFEKKYYAVVEGTPRENAGEIESYLKENEILRVFSSPTQIRDSKYALTFYEVIRSAHGRSLLEVTLKTGRKHQIRVHLALLGHPILGHRDYGNKTLAKRLALHAFCLTIRQPETGKWLTFKSDLPEDLRKLIS